MQEYDYTVDFPLYANHPDLAYLDSAATSLTAQVVLDKMDEYYTQYGTNVSRGVYSLCEQATAEYESVREKAAKFVNAQSSDEIIFTSGTTTGLNMLTHGLSITPRDHVIVTAMDHHANFVPWQIATDEGKFQIINITSDGILDLDDLKKKLSSETKILSLPYISNVLGTVNPVAQIVTIAREINPNIIIVIDAAQAAPHIKIDVQALDCDFLALSSHKMYGPTGTGILWGKIDQLEKLKPFITGGDMIAEVTTNGTTYRDLPHRLEAGTPNVAGVLGFGAAIDYINSIGYEKIAIQEQQLLTYTLESLTSVPGITIYGPQDSSQRVGVISFSIDSIHPHDVAAVLDQEACVAVRAGNHCTMPLHTEYLNIPATTRVSLGIYNTEDDIDALMEGLEVVQETFNY